MPPPTRAEVIAWSNRLASLLEEEPESAVDHLAAGKQVLAALDDFLDLGIENNVLRAHLWAQDAKAATAFFDARRKKNKRVLASALEDAAADVFDVAIDAGGFDEVLGFLAEFAKKQKWAAAARFELLGRLHGDSRLAAIEEINAHLASGKPSLAGLDAERLAREACLASIRADDLKTAATFLPRLMADRASWAEWKHTEEFQALLASPEGKAAAKARKK